MGVPGCPELAACTASMPRVRIVVRPKASSDVACRCVVPIRGALMRWIFSPAVQIASAMHRDTCLERCCEAVGRCAAGDAAQRADVAHDNAPAGGHEP